MKIYLSLLLVIAAVPACLGQAGREYDKYGGVISLKGKNTSSFHAEEIKGRCYFVTPEGNAFFSLGVTHTGETIRQDEIGIFKSRFNSSEEKMGEFFLERLRNWGFNSAGYGALEMMENRIPYVATIWTEGPRSFSAGERSRNADIFDPAVQERLRGKVRAAAARHVGNPYCLGYVFIDLPVWHPKPVRGESYCNFIRSLDPGAPGRKAYDDFAAQRRAENEAAVDEAFLNRMADTYYTCVVGELRKCDPNHLVLGDRFMALPDRTPNSILVTAARHVDVISFQPMGTQKMLREYMDEVFRLTGKPVLLADVNTMTERPKQGQTDTVAYERAAGEHTLEYYLNAAGSKYCLGIHRCTVRDYQPWNPQYHRRGLLKADDTPYEILVDYTRRTNLKVYDLVYEAAK